MTPITEQSIGIDGKVFAERRGKTRHRVLKGAVLTFNRGFGAMECQVRNQSETGARLSMGETLALPAQFEIAIAGEKPSRAAQVRWRTMTAVGVSFG